VPPFSVVAGNPAKVMFRMKKPTEQRDPKQEERSV
jgi:acetyltransferase-like isoleucine patch superfamily enzyme